MKLIKHIIPVEIDDGQVLLINSLNGMIDKVDASTFETITKWQDLDKITPENEFESDLFSSLNSRGYTVNSIEEEMARKNEVIKVLREQYQKNRRVYNSITFIPSYNCNFRCPYCFEGEVTRKKEIMTTEQVDAALALAGDSYNIVSLFGGEPLMLENRPIIEYIASKTKDKLFSIVTNGYYVMEYFDLLIQLKIIRLCIVIDGKEETHNSRRILADGGPTYQKIMQGIEKCLENGINVGIRMNVDDSNFEECKELRLSLVNKFEKYKDFLGFQISTLVGSMEDDVDYDAIGMLHELYEEDIEYTLEERLRRNAIMSSFGPIINALTMGERPKPTYSFCFANEESTLIVDPYGHIHSCLRGVGVEDLAVGTYYPEVKFKESGIHTRNIETIPECTECIYSLLCGGGCPMKSATYDDDTHKPVCTAIHKQIHSLLPRIYQTNRDAAAKKANQEAAATQA